MKLDEIIGAVASETQLPRQQVKTVVDALFDTIRAKVEGGEKVSVAGMGSFVLNEREAGTRIDKDGATREVAAARFVTFRPSRSATGRGGKGGEGPAA